VAPVGKEAVLNIQFAESGQVITDLNQVHIYPFVYWLLLKY